MKWEISAENFRPDEFSVERVSEILLANRGIKSSPEREKFLRPPQPEDLEPSDLGIAEADMAKAKKRILKAISAHEPIVVYGDYDADGMCATAIMWEALNGLGAVALPFIPLREKEGYGLSKEGIDSILQDPRYKIQETNGLIITVDSGIVAGDAVKYSKQKNLDVIVLDHHEKPKLLPESEAIVHTEKLCASGIAYFVACGLVDKTPESKQLAASWLELAAIATVTDLMPLLGPNRSIVKYGLDNLNKTSRPGLKALFEIAGIEKVDTYEIGFMIGPRLNASGRIENALSGLRLLCTKNPQQARELADNLNQTNKLRQDMLKVQTEQALQEVIGLENIIILESETFHQGVIGLIAGELVKKHYLPAIVIAKADGMSKASARSISGFNIIDAIREADKLLINAGGHPMAAGFTIETANISQFRSQITQVAKEKITPEMRERKLKVDMNIPPEKVSLELLNLIEKLAPFGIGNPKPIFSSPVQVSDIRTVGQEGKHLKLVVGNPESKFSLDAIAFNQGELVGKIKPGDKINVAYSVSLNTFNGRSKLQLEIKDIRL